MNISFLLTRFFTEKTTINPLKGPRNVQPSMPNWNDLRIFLEVYRAGSLSGAARHLRIDVSTVSRRIASLERSLSAPVFERHPSGLKLTFKGKEILTSVEAMESQLLATAGAGVASLNQHLKGEVRIGTMEGIASFYLAKKLSDFSHQYPDLHVELITSPHQVHVNRREADVFLSFYPYEAKGLDIMPVGKFKLYLYASDEYIRNHGIPENKEQLKQHKFVSYIDDLVELDTVRWLDEIIANPQIVFSSSSMIAQMFAASGGCGLVMLPDFMHAEHYGMQKVLDQTLFSERVIWLSVHKELRFLPKIKTVIHFLVESFKQDYPNTPGITIV